MIKVTTIGHVVLFVSDLDKSTNFYQEVLGLTLFERAEGMVFLTADPSVSHQLALFQATDETLSAPGQCGLNHHAWAVKTFEELQQMYDKLKKADIPIAAVRDHTIALGVYFKDPDGLLVEVYHELPREQWQEFSVTKEGYPYTLEL